MRAFTTRNVSVSGTTSGGSGASPSQYPSGNSVCSFLYLRSHFGAFL